MYKLVCSQEDSVDSDTNKSRDDVCGHKYVLDVTQCHFRSDKGLNICMPTNINLSQILSLGRDWGNNSWKNTQSEQSQGYVSGPKYILACKIHCYASQSDNSVDLCHFTWRFDGDDDYIMTSKSCIFYCSIKMTELKPQWFQYTFVCILSIVIKTSPLHNCQTVCWLWN